MTWVWAESTIPLIPAIPVEHGGVCRRAWGRASREGQGSVSIAQSLLHPRGPGNTSPWSSNFASPSFLLDSGQKIFQIGSRGMTTSSSLLLFTFSHLRPQPTSKARCPPTGSWEHLRGCCGRLWVILVNGKRWMCICIPCWWSGSWSSTGLSNQSLCNCSLSWP